MALITLIDFCCSIDGGGTPSLEETPFHFAAKANGPTPLTPHQFRQGIHMPNHSYAGDEGGKKEEALRNKVKGERRTVKRANWGRKSLLGLATPPTPTENMRLLMRTCASGIQFGRRSLPLFHIVNSVAPAASPSRSSPMAFVCYQHSYSTVRSARHRRRAIASPQSATLPR
jgi:hypothetical protein